MLQFWSTNKKSLSAFDQPDASAISPHEALYVLSESQRIASQHLAFDGDSLLLMNHSPNLFVNALGTQVNRMSLTQYCLPAHYGVNKLYTIGRLTTI